MFSTKNIAKKLEFIDGFRRQRHHVTEQQKKLIQ